MVHGEIENRTWICRNCWKACMSLKNLGLIQPRLHHPQRARLDAGTSLVGDLQAWPGQKHAQTLSFMSTDAFLSPGLAKENATINILFVCEPDAVLCCVVCSNSRHIIHQHEHTHICTLMDQKCTMKNWVENQHTHAFGCTMPLST